MPNLDAQGGNKTQNAASSDCWLPNQIVCLGWINKNFSGHRGNQSQSYFVTNELHGAAIIVIVLEIDLFCGHQYH